MKSCFIFTFHAALTPEARMCKNLFVLLARLVVARALGATHSGRVKPIICSYCDGHEAESSESSSCSDEHLCSTVARPHRSSISLESLNFSDNNPRCSINKNHIIVALTLRLKSDLVTFFRKCSQTWTYFASSVKCKIHFRLTMKS